MKFYILEDFYQVADEKSLLHFFNSLREAGVLLLLSARISSKKFKIEDLSSYLENIPTVVIEDSSKEVLQSLLLNRLARKEIKASKRLIKLILSEVRKSYGTLNEKMKREIS
jgi:chromosomal replication initiation ATPase DnaA